MYDIYMCTYFKKDIVSYEIEKYPCAPIKYVLNVSALPFLS